MKRVLTLAIISSTLVSCPRHSDLCGSGRYKCVLFHDTSPRSHPIKYDSSNNAALFENGDLLIFSGIFRDSVVLDLPVTCGSDSIRDVVFYNWTVAFANYSGYSEEHLPSPQEYFVLAVAENKCCKLDTNYQQLLEFGNRGSSDSCLIDAACGAVDVEGNSYIIDRGDNSVKIYDKDGNFQNRWGNLGSPYRLKLFDDATFILDRQEGTIKKYDMGGNCIRDLPGLSDFQNTVTFGFTYKDVIWVVDLDGGRLSEVTLSGRVKEMKVGYCHENVDYAFEHVSYLEGDAGGFVVADRDANRLLSFSTGPTD